MPRPVERFLEHVRGELASIEAEGLTKHERAITSQQQADIEIEIGAGPERRRVVNLCANNYLGLANHPDVMAAAKAGIDRYGFGVASVRFICGTQDLHHALEERLSTFLGTDATILYSSCFDANTGLFETLLGPEDAIISDTLNHASIIDGVRLCKAQRFRYANADLADLERQLEAAKGARFRLIATDGVFSMDGVVAPLEGICDLAERFDAMVMVDDSHAVGFMGEHGRGTHEHCGVMGRVDLITGTLGKALGGASGGYTSGRADLVALLRQRSRPYLFSNALAPVVAAASLRVLDLLEGGDALRRRVHANAARFRHGMHDAGFELAGADHPIVPVMIGDAALAARMAERLLDEGLYVVGFSFPVVPRGQARIRTQLSALHSDVHIDTAIRAFTDVGRELGVIA
ncbi:MAG: glycine C-acetyltransferase [Trueperaceae bacterium]|nr:MAG: glycine C-acetyltransferase [Trueperaceae bacterium]